MDHRIVHRAYTLVEAGVARADAIEDLLTLANGERSILEAALVQAAELGPTADDAADETLEMAGFDPELNRQAALNQRGLTELLASTLASID